MAIAPVAKVTFYGTTDQKQIVLDGLQELGCLHLLDLNQQGEEIIGERHLSPDVPQALKYLRSCPIQRRAVTKESAFHFDDVLAETLTNAQQQQELQSERDELQQAIEKLIPWGDFRFPSDNELDGLRLWFYVVPHARFRSVEESTAIWQIVAKDQRFVYVVIVSREEPHEISVPRVQLDDRPLSELRHRLETIETELEELHWQRVRLTRWIVLLSRMIGLAEDRAQRERAARNAFDDPSLFALQGWAPQSKLELIRAFTREHGLGLTVEAPTAEDSPPTLLSNRGLAAGGEDAVTFYTTPAYRTWDPSGVVFLSFSIFFAMIMADAGYAVLLVLILLATWRRLGRSSNLLRFRTLFAAIAFASVVYGIAVGSYFGFPLPSGSLLNRLHVIDASDSAMMMRISICIGVIHLAIANLALAWTRRWSPIMLSSIGWVAALFGGLAWGLGESGTQPQQTLIHYGSWGLQAGLLCVLLFSSSRPITTLNPITHGRRLLDGLLALAGVSRAFGDVLSYLRLFALGLASAQLAATFNDLANDPGGGLGGVLIVIAVVLGHGLNFVLAIMGGVVHGLRLNCIEFFGWSLPDEGYPFEPFRKRAT